MKIKKISDIGFRRGSSHGDTFDFAYTKNVLCAWRKTNNKGEENELLFFVIYYLLFPLGVCRALPFSMKKMRKTQFLSIFYLANSQRSP